MTLSPQEELERISAENLQLHEAVTKQTTELEHKNRELEIEAALERVRTCAMAMQKPEDMLSVCRIIFQQLEILRVKNIRNVQTIILNDPRDSFTNYEYFNLYDKESIIEVPYAAHSIITDFVHQIKSSDDYFFFSKIEGEALDDWRQYLISGQEKVDPRLESATSLIYYMYSIGPGALGVSMYDTPMPDEDVVVLKRFRNVFQLAYRRYSDIEQAEAQAREARIEAALEKVRAVAMSMSSSNDLLNVCEVLYQQLQSLGFNNLRNAMINIHDDAKSSYINYDFSDKMGKSMTPFSTDVHPVIEKQIKQIRSADDAFSETVFTGQDLEDWKEFRRRGGEQDDPRIDTSTSLHYYLYSIGTGSIGISTFQAIDSDQLDLLKRFRNVFSLSYQRYIDIAQAEAQAREAQIQLGLERVRARTMAMQRSDELTEASAELYSQLTILGEPAQQLTIGIIKEAEGVVEVSVTLHGNKLPKTIRHPISEPYLMQKMYDAWKAGKKTFILELRGEELIAYNQFRNNLVGENLFPVNLTPDHHRIISFANFSKGTLALATDEPRPAESLQLVERFAAVFELTYTRFLDLLRSEEQTREARIELALERVRARTMAMQRSEEMVEASHVLFNELHALGIETIRTGVATVDAEHETVTVWSSQLVAKNDIKILGVVPKNAHSFFDGYLNAWKKKEPYFSFSMVGDEVNSYYTTMSSVLSYPLQSEFNPKETFQVFFFPEGSLNVITHEPLSEESCQLLVRFARVFGLIYRRFLDLKQAEAQAQEARIESSLERVRTTAMIMRKPDELSKVGEVIFSELKLLGFADLRNTEIVINEDKKEGIISYYYSDYGITGVIEVLYFDNPILKKWAAEMKSADDAFSKVEILENQIETWKAYRESIGYLPDPKLDAANRVYYYSYSTGLGALSISSFEPISDEQMLTLGRFRNVFGLAYRRYVDVAQAETQAREAQIELALERVRARTMAMQRSDELSETAQILFQQFKDLGETPIQITIGIINEEERDIEFNVTDSSGIGNKIDQAFKASIDEPTLMRKIYDAWKAEKKSITIVLTGQELLDWVAYRIAMSGIKNQGDHQIKLHHRRVVTAGFFSKGLISISTLEPLPNETIPLLERFAGVFDQTFTRFLDLQKAEAQARESQIELGLERVRARAMAMQGSNELSDLVDTVFKELTKLDFALNWCIINIIDESSLSNRVWAANPDIDKAPDSYHMKFENYPFHDAMMKGYKERATKYIYVLEGLEKKIYDEYLFTETEFRKVPKAAQDASRAMEKYVVSFSFSNFGGLQTVGNEPLSDSNLDILERFGKVFDLTYTRFNDLQKAEAQAREAQIQLTLERVRARTMAMQHSDELKVAAALLFQQVIALGVPAYSCGYNIWEKDEKEFTSWMSTQDGSIINGVPNIPLTEDANFIRYVESKQNGEEFFVLELRGDRMQEHYEYLKTIPAFKAYFDYAVSVGFDLPETQIHYLANFSHGNLLFITLEPCPEFHDVFKRFADVFDQTYTRFLDLEKAEAQSREAQIQLALERVRARTMAMQRSDELQDAAIVLFQQINSLGVETGSCGFNIWDQDENSATVWMSSPEGGLQEPFKLVHTESEIYKEVMEAVRSRKNFLVKEVSGETLKKHFDYLLTLPGIGTVIKELRNKNYSFPQRIIYHFAFFNQGYLSFHLQESRPETNDIFKRFATVFEQTYTRFLDLQKAEAQAKEAQIEAALERVRSRTMGMQKSEELKEVIQVVFEQFIHLHINIGHTGFVMDYKTRDDYDIWVADPLGVPAQIIIPYFDCEYYNRFNEAKEKGEDFFATNLSFEEKNRFYKKLFEYVPGLPEEAKQFYFSCPGLAASTVLLDNVCLYIENFSGTPYTDEENVTLMRFGKVFQQTYTRFLDLQKAETQAREAKIEASLERVRSRAMTMHKGDELLEIIQIIFQELSRLGINLMECSIVAYDTHPKDLIYWSAGPIGSAQPSSVKLQYIDHPLLIELFNDFENGVQYRSGEYSGELLKTWWDRIFIETDFKFAPDEFIESWKKITRIYYSQFAMKHGFVEFLGESPLPEDKAQLLKRFTNVVDLTYTRYDDVVKAEAQTREAKIEASLERVRAKAMAMHHSDELDEVLAVLCEQFDILGIFPMSTHMTVFDLENNKFTFRETGKFGNRSFGEQTLDLDAMDTWKETVDQWKASKALSLNRLHFPKETLPIVWEVFHESFASMPENSRITPEDYPDGIYHTAGKHPFGYIGMNQVRKATEEEEQIVVKFANEFGRAYQRFLDLQKAEAQTREAQIEAGLERVRSRTLAMQSSDELAETAAVVFRQLIGLGIAPTRLYIGIIHDDSGNIELWATDEDGSKVNTQFTGNIHRSASMQKMYAGWKEQLKSLTIDMTGQELKDYFHYLSDELKVPFKLGLDQQRRVQNLAYFSKGFIGIASPDEQPEETITLLERFASVFNLTFTRFNDLKIAEHHAEQAREDLIKLQIEKKRAEDALSELRATQTQLIQSEKMASLGELTAGIAHEIQNPLNFVNNFSEVNTELIEELKDELANGNMQLANELAENIKDNEEKIVFHGKRADAIVKGMLQHSRSSSGVKEPTDINALADEYLRLAYHGLRAKDKSFNATMKTDFDPNIGLINVVPQDIGRVILNLITNAFYAVASTPPLPPDGGKQYLPTVTVTTKKLLPPIGGKGGEGTQGKGEEIEIRVADNGPGIPQNILDKIFQPFFTTKPTGQGTGLGLSLSYDIIKAHGGELKVETKVGEGSEFIIQLPV